MDRSVLGRQIRKIEGLRLRPDLLLTLISALMGVYPACEEVMFLRARPQELHSAEDVPVSEGTVRVPDGDNGTSKVPVRIKPGSPVQSLGEFDGLGRVEPVEGAHGY